MPNPVYFDRRKQPSITTGTGAFTLTAPTGPWKQLNTSGAALTLTYCIAHQTAGDWETGVGSVDSTSSTLTRTYALDGSAGPGTFTNFSGGNKDVFSTAISSYLPRVRPGICEGRLGLVSGSPGADSASGSTLYFTPYMGNQIAMPEPTLGTGQWKLYDFTEMSISLGVIGLTAGMCYDIFVGDSNGTLSLGANQWTNATTRSSAITYVDGIPMVGPATQGYRYLGTFYAANTSNTADSPKQRFVWNYYNQMPRRMANFPGTGSWSATGLLAWRAQNADATKARALEFVLGLAPFRPVNARATIYVVLGTTGTWVGLGLTLDGTGAPSYTDSVVIECSAYNNSYFAQTTATAEYNQIPATVGYHYLQPVEDISVGAYGVIWYDSVANRNATGVIGTIWA